MIFDIFWLVMNFLHFSAEFVKKVLTKNKINDIIILQGYGEGVASQKAVTPFSYIGAETKRS